ncbi:MAG: ABC transporter ATP-binding protein [Alphaproteobacteria bacterium]
MLRTLFTPVEPPRWLRFYERFIPADPPREHDPSTMPEHFTDLKPADDLPETPAGFALFVIRNHFAGRILLLYAAVILAITAESFTPYALNGLVDSLGLVAEGDDGASGTALTWFLVLGGLWLATDFFFRTYDALDIYLSPRMRALSQKYLFRYLLGHAPRYFQDNFAGRLAQKVHSAAQAINALTWLIVRELTQVLVLLSVSLVLLTLETPLLAVVLAVWTVIYLFLAAFLARHCSVLSKDLANRKSSLSGKIVDSIGNNDVVRAFAGSRHERSYVSHYWMREMVGSMTFRWYLTIMRGTQSIAMWVLNIALIGLSIREVLLGAMSIGAFTMVFVLVTLISRALRQISFQILDFFEYYGNLAESLEVINEPQEIREKPGAKPLRVTEGAIRFENVGFAHRDGTPVFRNLNLDIAPGEKVGLVGRSGAGKSTLVKLLRRQFDPQQGRILIDGQDVRDVTWDSVNEAVAEVPQVPGIFHRSIRDNIRYAQPDADMATVEHAAHLSHADEFITRRRTSYDTMVGEQGIKLSGGERQRVAIARAFMKDARILVLDEATSALDSEAEQMIQQALFNLMQGRTVIAIAHRLSTITGLDRIILLEHGEIIEQGSHEDLVARGGAYAHLWSIQAGGFVGMEDEGGTLGGAA